MIFHSLSIEKPLGNIDFSYQANQKKNQKKTKSIKIIFMLLIFYA